MRASLIFLCVVVLGTLAYGSPNAPLIAKPYHPVMSTESSVIVPAGMQRLMELVQRRSALAGRSAFRSQGLCPNNHVSPPSFLDMSKYTPVEQTVFGVVAVLIEDLGEGLRSLISGHPSESCSTCFCEVVGVAEELYKAVGEFRDMIEDFSMSKARAALGDLSGVARKIESALHPCGLSEEKTEEIIAAAAAWLTGLEEVISAIDLALKGFKIYCEADALVTAWENKDWFNVGVNIGRLINIAVSVAEGGHLFSKPAPVAPSTFLDSGVTTSNFVWTNDSCVVRRPGGVWETCTCGEPLSPMRDFGNFCESVKAYQASVQPRATASSGGLGAGALAGVIVAAVFIGLVGFVAGYKVSQKRESKRREELAETFISDNERL